MCSSGCSLSQGLANINVLYVKLTYQVSAVQNLGEWSKYVFRQGEMWAGEFVSG